MPGPRCTQNMLIISRILQASNVNCVPERCGWTTVDHGEDTEPFPLLSAEMWLPQLVSCLGWMFMKHLQDSPKQDTGPCHMHCSAIMYTQRALCLLTQTGQWSSHISADGSGEGSVFKQDTGPCHTSQPWRGLTQTAGQPHFCGQQWKGLCVSSPKQDIGPATFLRTAVERALWTLVHATPLSHGEGSPGIV